MRSILAIPSTDGLGVTRERRQLKGLVMFGFLESLVKAATAVVTVPVALVADAASLVGIIPDTGSHTGEAVDDLIGNLKDATRPNSK